MRVRKRLLVAAFVIGVYFLVTVAFGGHVARWAAHAQWVDRPYDRLDYNLLCVRLFLADGRYQRELIIMMESDDEADIRMAAARLQQIADGMDNSTLKRLEFLSRDLRSSPLQQEAANFLLGLRLALTGLREGRD
jgi:hypothetical protein